MESMGLKNSFWKGKKVFITGHSGFKGSWASYVLHMLGANVKGYSLKPDSESNLFDSLNLSNLIYSDFQDIRDKENLMRSIQEFNPDIIFHMAAQPLVRDSYNDPIYTYEVNVIGTATLLEVSRSISNLGCIINITTDKCYQNKEWAWSYREDDELGGHDPYSSSKACAELVSKSYYSSFIKDKGIGLATVRAGNVIGGGDWSKDRLIPDIINTFSQSNELLIRNPFATRPWQHVLEPIFGYFLLAEKLYENREAYSEAWNFGPNEGDIRSVKWIVEEISKYWNNPRWDIDKSSNPHEAQNLKLDISKAKSLLKWQPKLDIKEALYLTNSWYKAYLEKMDMIKITEDQIISYIKK